MKAFLGTLAALAIVTIAWNYWAMHRVQAPGAISTNGRYRAPGPNGPGGRRGPGPATDITGTVRMAGGVSHGAHVDLVRVAGEGAAARVYAGQEALGDGRFTFTAVIPDRYWAVARTELDPDPLRPGEGQPQAFYGFAEVVSDGEHPSHVAIQLHPATTISGRVTVEPGAAMSTRDFTLLTISLRPVDAQAKAAIATGDASSGLTSDGRFTIGEVPPGHYKLDISPSPWTVDAMTVADHDRLDLPFQIGTGERIAASVSLTERANQIGGSLRDGAGRALPYALVSVFAVDAAQREAHRRVQLIRTDGKGAFRFDGLPSGDYLLAPAINFEPQMWRTVAFFERLTGDAVRVSLGHGRLVSRDLKIAAR